jgi:hypothetical protein
MGTFNQFSVARELLQRRELEQALVEVDRLVALGAVGDFGGDRDWSELEWGGSFS